MWLGPSRLAGERSRRAPQGDGIWSLSQNALADEVFTLFMARSGRIGRRDDEDIGVAGGAQSQSPCAFAKSAAGGFSGPGPHSRPQPAIHSADAAPRGRCLLARASSPRGPPGPGARTEERYARGLDLAAGDCAQGRSPGDVPVSSYAVSRAPLRARPGILLRLRPAGLSARLAYRPVGGRHQQKRDLAFRLCGRLEFLERAERPRTPAQAHPAPALRGNWQTFAP